MRVALSIPEHLIAAGRIAAYREASTADGVPHKTRVYLLQRSKDALSALVRDLDEALIRAGFHPAHSSPPELILERAEEGLDAWLAWQPLTREGRVSGVLGLELAPVSYEYAMPVRVAVESARAPQQKILTITDPVTVFLANVDALLTRAVEELVTAANLSRATPKACWERLVASAERLTLEAKRRPRAELKALLMRGRWLLPAEQERRLRDSWKKQVQEADAEARALLAAIVMDWVDAGRDAGSQPRSRLAAAVARAQYLADGITRATAARVREAGEAEGVHVISSWLIPTK